jgi:FG-GAP repeat
MHNIRRSIQAWCVATFLTWLSLPALALGLTAKPAGMDDASWSALQEAVSESVLQQAKLTGSSNIGADGLDGDQFGYSLAVSGDTVIVGAPGDTVGSVFKQGSAYVYARNGATWSLQAKLVAADGAIYNWFGHSIALAGDTALIGAYGSDFDQGAAYVFTRSGSSWTQQAKLVADDRAFDDEFGYSVALSGDTAIVGAHTDDAGVVDQGSAYVFTRSGTSWTQQAKLVADDGASLDDFGSSVAIDGDSVLVGAAMGDVGVANRGSAYVFTRSGTSWSQQARLTAKDGAENDHFGVSVALSGDTALIGANAADAGFSNEGSAYVFTRVGAMWSEQAKLVADDGQPFDFFGFSVALSGDTALVGMYAPVTNRGAYVFSRSGEIWSQQAGLEASDGMAYYGFFGHAVALSGDTIVSGAYVGDNGRGSVYAFTGGGASWNLQTKLTAGVGVDNEYFGYSVAVSGDTALVGTPSHDGLYFDQGAAYVFTRSGTSWMLQSMLVAGDGVSDEFGISVALFGDTALIGAWKGDGSFTDQGAAYVFTRVGTSWSQQARLTAADAATNDHFGISVALSGDTALVGANADDGDRGSAYVFTRSGTNWSQQAKLTAADGVAGDAFGTVAALYNDAALVGAWRDDVDFADQGSAYVFTRNGTSWSQQARLTAGDAALDDGFGYAVAIYADTALIGAWLDDVDFADQGSAYVFTRSGNDWSQQTRLTAGDASAADRFGASVALSGDVALVGAVLDDGDFEYQGSAYLYTRFGTSWSQHAKLTATDAEADDEFGNAVALSGDTALVGAYARGGAPPYGNPGEGAAYVFADLPTAPFAIFGDGFEQ